MSKIKSTTALVELDDILTKEVEAARAIVDAMVSAYPELSSDEIAAVMEAGMRQFDGRLDISDEAAAAVALRRARSSSLRDGAFAVASAHEQLVELDAAVRDAKAKGLHPHPIDTDPARPPFNKRR
jgi:hypothetical protein